MSDLPPPSPTPDVPPPSTPEIPPASVAPEPPVVSSFESTPTPPIGDVPATGPTPKDNEEKTLGMVMHLLPLSGLVLVWTHIPFLNVIAPLVLWLVKKDTSPYLDAVGKEVINFQITVGIAGIVGFLLCFVCIGIPLLIALAIAMVVLIVLAAIDANKGKFYRYPYILRLIK